MFKALSFNKAHEITRRIKSKYPNKPYDVLFSMVLKQNRLPFILAYTETLAKSTVIQWVPEIDANIRNREKQDIVRYLFRKYKNAANLKKQQAIKLNFTKEFRKVNNGIVGKFYVQDWAKFVRKIKEGNAGRIINLSYNGINWKTLYVDRLGETSYNGVEIRTSGEGYGSDVEMIYEIKRNEYFYAKLRDRINNTNLRQLFTQGFFKYLNTYEKLNLERYQIYHKHKKDVMPCFQHCLKIAGLDSKPAYKHIALARITNKTVQEIAEKMNIQIKLTQFDGTQDKVKIYGLGDMLELGSVDGHIFINEKTKYPIYAIKHYDELQNKNKQWYQYKKANELVKRNDKRATSYQIIKWMYLNKKFTPLTDKQLMQTSYYDESKLTTALPVDKNECRGFFNSKNDKVIDTLIFADTEASTDGIHREYMISYQVYTLEGVKTASADYFQDDCIYKFLNVIGSLYDLSKTYIYFHNLAYDIKYFINKPGVIVLSMVKMGSSIYAATLKYNGKNYQLKDSYPMLTDSLRKLAKTYLPSHTQKEIYPYNFYTRERIEKMYAGNNCASDFLNGLRAEYSNDDFANGLELFESLNSCPIAYAKYYCQRDVECLAQVFLKFRNLLIESVKLDTCDFISSASLAMTYVKRDKCLENCYEIGGNVRAFVQKCFYGGRVMARENKKWHTTQPLVDYDAVSLYPSAMARIDGMIEGKPELITNINKDVVYTDIPDYLKSYSYYYLRIKIESIGIMRAFPLICKRDDSGNHYVNECIELYLGKIDLEDLINFQHISFKIIDGYGWKNGFNSIINTTIKKLFDERIKMKKAESDTQVAYKLIMNSSYGKLAMKPRDTELKFKYNNDRYIHRNQHRISSIDTVGVLDIVKVKKEIASHFNSVHQAAMITAMSRRIMNEVMCLAEDNNIVIYYQDTDSMHMLREDLPKLKKLYTEKYNRELDGDLMGQFNSDFKDDCYAVESYFLGKKCYVDKLSNGSYHIRMKGVPNSTIKYTCEKNNLTVLELYKKLYDGEKISFDLLEGGSVFRLKINSNMTQETIKEFKREIKF